MEKFLEFNGVKMAYTVAGSGSPVVLMHGWGCTRQTVQSIQRLCVPHHTVYSVDFPGFGDSSEPPTVWGTEEYTRIIEELVNREGIEDPILIGHSFGGRIAIIYASRNRVSKVILVDAAGIKPKRSLKYYFKVYSFKLAKKIYRLLLGEERSARKIAEMRAKRGSSDYAAASPTMRAILSKVVNEDLSHLLPKIVAPTLLVWGENDSATPIKDARKMEKLLPDAGLVAFEGCGHYSFLERPAAFAAVINNFIN